MASQPSVYNEERNRLRLRAWEQRNLETGQTKELNAENVPLFGEPYKTNKGDELSNRIQRMLGSYEDGNNPNSFPCDSLPTPTYVIFSQLDQCQPDKSAKPSSSTQVHFMAAQSQKCPCSSNHSSQPMRMSSASSSPNQHGHSSTLSKTSLNYSPGSQPDHSAHEQKKSDTISDLREHISLPQETTAQSLDAKSLDLLHSSDYNNTETDTKDKSDRHQLQGSLDHSSTSSSTIDVSTLNIKQSPKDASLPQANKTNTLPSQTFPPILSSKQPSVVMTQKPTAYVRPMDGQDQVVSESPDLKPSPELYPPLPELINKSEQGKRKMLPQVLETKTNEDQCVEDILKEMTQLWPPLLTAIRTPSTEEPSKSPLSAKEAEPVSSCPGKSPSQLNQQKSSLSFEATHSCGVESASSSGSEGSSRSESECESATEEPLDTTLSSSVKPEPDAPAVRHDDWQLGNWIRSSQQSSSIESQGGALVSESPAHKQPQPIQSTKHSSVDVANPIRESELSSQQKEVNNNVAKSQHCNERSQDNYQQSFQQSPSVGSCKSPCNMNSKPLKAGCPDHIETAFSIKCEEVAATRVKDPCFTDGPKVKTKTKYSKKCKDNGNTKRDSKRTFKHMPLDKRKAGSQPKPEVALVLYGHCPSCGVRYPNPCFCPAQSPAPPDQLSPAPPVRISCSKVKPEVTCQKSTKMPHKTSHKLLEKTRHTGKGSRDLSGPPRSLLVRIDLTLLSRVPKTSRSQQELSNNATRSAVVTEQNLGGSDASTIHRRKTTKKINPQNADVDDKTHPRKKQKLENDNTSSTHCSAKLENSRNPVEDWDHKKAKKNPIRLPQPVVPKNTSKDSKLHKHSCGYPQESSKVAAKSKDSSKHKRSEKQKEHQHIEKQKAPTSNLAVPLASQPNKEALINRPLLKFEDRQYPVKRYIKEAKRLKHKADAETNKFSKAFSYLDAAMYFVESGIAMEKDPHISMSSYTMFAETVELLKFVLKLKNSVDQSVPPSEKDFLALCLKCQSLLQMAMFRHKHKTALEYSKTLTDHFSSSAQAPHDSSVVTSLLTNISSPMSSMLSPAGPGFSHSVAASSGLTVGSVGSSVAVPRSVEQVAFTYVNITTLFLNAHDIWEQAEELAHKGSGMLTELDTLMGPLSLTSTMSTMVRYTRQGVHWLRLDSQKVK